MQPILVWDDGTELTAAPVVEAKALPVSALVEFAEALPEEVARIAAQIEGPPIDEPPLDRMSRTD